jgi:hypothetical protein
MREHIVSEIKRIAMEDGGKPPGKISFRKRTGISESDWSGKIWSRWGDALVEAGFQPNKLQDRLPSELVLGQYIEACRHLGKIPSSTELRLYLGQREKCISHNTFFKHFGGREGLLRALLEHALSEGEIDILAMMPAGISNTQVVQKTGEKELSVAIAEGWVYLLQSGDYFKIGRSDDIEKRVKQISVAMPEKLELVHAIRTDDASGIEAYWHRRFSSKRANGEWFKLSSTDIKAFKRRKFQ